jgi:hypothetical protein
MGMGGGERPLPAAYGPVASASKIVVYIANGRKRVKRMTSKVLVKHRFWVNLLNSIHQHAATLTNRRSADPQLARDLGLRLRAFRGTSLGSTGFE